MKTALGVITGCAWQGVMQIVCFGAGLYAAYLYIEPFTWWGFLLQGFINIVILEVIFGFLSFILVFLVGSIWAAIKRE